MKRVLRAVAVVAASSVWLVSCGYSNPSGSSYSTSGLTFRAFVSNPLSPSGATLVPVLQIVDASHDALSGSLVNLSGISATPGLMAVSPNKSFTLVYSDLGTSIALVDNSTEQSATKGTFIILPAATESMFVALDNATAYVAVPNAPVTGQSPGAVLQYSLATGGLTATLPVPSVHYIVSSHNGNRILAFGDNQNTVTVIAPSLIGTSTDPRTFVCADGTPQTDLSLCDPNPPSPVLDHPVWGIFSSDDSTAYILSCGSECGGTSAEVTVLDLATNTAAAPVPVDGATMGLLSGSTLYVAGTKPGTGCTSGTSATSCGTLSVIDLGSMTVTATAEVTDGYHHRIAMGANGQVFLGAKHCTNIDNSASGGEVRGCLSIFNTHDLSVVIAPDNDDVTGMEVVPNRNVVYVCEGGELRIYDTTTDQLQATQVDIIGQAVDVKIVDF